MAGVVAGGLVAASTIITYIAYIVAIGLRFTQLRIYLQFNGAGDIVFENFVLIDKLVNGFKLFISAYRQVHAEGVGLLAFSCLIGFSIHLCAIVIHLYNNHRSRARAWISGMAVFLAAGACMLAMKIPQDYAWHSIAVEAILDVFICLEAVLLVLSKMSDQGGNDNLLRDLIMTSVETLINYWLFADYLANTRSPWDAERILHLVGSSLAVLIGVGQLGWLAYKAYTHGVFAWGEKMDGGDIEQQGAEVEEGVTKTTPAFTRDVEMAAGAATMEAAGDEGKEVPGSS